MKMKHFSKNPEATNADLSKVKEELTKRGDLTDDLSILKITYEKHALENTNIKTEEDLRKKNWKWLMNIKTGLTNKAISML